MFCETLQIDVPDSFPLASWQAFYDAGKLVTSKSDCSPGESDCSSGDFSRALVATLYRFKSCDESLLAMIGDWQKHDGALRFDGHYRQQRDLFIFYSCGLSAIESALYTCYVFACKRHPAKFNWLDKKARRRDADPSRIEVTLGQALAAGHQCMLALSALLHDPHWKSWNGLRNTMVHRSLPPRLFEATAGGPPPPKVMLKYASTWSTDDLRMSESDMEQQLHWLARQIDSLMKGGAAI